MRVTAKSDYALRALVELAAAQRDSADGDARDAPISAEELGRLQDIPHGFLQAILADEVNAFHFDLVVDGAEDRAPLHDTQPLVAQPPFACALGQHALIDCEGDCIRHLPQQCSLDPFPWRHASLSWYGLGSRFDRQGRDPGPSCPAWRAPGASRKGAKL